MSGDRTESTGSKAVGAETVSGRVDGRSASDAVGGHPNRPQVVDDGTGAADTVAPFAGTGADGDVDGTGPGVVGEPPSSRDAGAAPRRRLPRYLAVVLGLAALAFFLTFVRGLQDVIAPVFLGLNLMIVVHPVQRWLSVRIHRFLAATVALVLGVGIVLSFFLVTGWALSQLVVELPRHNTEFLALWQQARTWLDGLGIDGTVIQQALNGVSAGNVMSLLTPVLSNVTAVTGAMVTLVLALFFLAVDSVSLPERLRLIAGNRPHITDALTSFALGVRRYWLVTTVFGLIVAVFDVVALAIIGVPLIWAWGVLSFLTNYIPNIGFVIGLVPPALLALLTGGWWPAVAVVIAYSLLNFVIQSIIQPKFTGESVGITPAMSFLSLLFWYWVLGWIGALVALPATLLLKALLVDADPRARWINAFISSRPSDAVPDRVPDGP